MFSAVEEEGPGIVRMKLIRAFGRCVRSLMRSAKVVGTKSVYVSHALRTYILTEAEDHDGGVW